MCMCVYLENYINVPMFLRCDMLIVAKYPFPKMLHVIARVCLKACFPN